MNATSYTSYEEDASSNPAPQAAPHNERIGDILRRVREHRQEELHDIADYLCIRQAYLYAMEESDYGSLPAEAYVIGFLRSYALYLGLDGQGAVEQYRREMAGRGHIPNLSMPQPVPEGRAPTIALLAGAAVAVFLIYGLWYGLSTPEDAATKQPIPLPQPTTLMPSEPQSEEKIEGNLLQETTSPGIKLSVTGVDETALPKDAAKKMGALLTTKKEDIKKPVKEEVIVVTAPEKRTEKKEVKKVVKEEAPKKEKEKKKEVKKETPALGHKGKARVFIKALKKSWILITDKKGLTVFDRILKKGQRYAVRDGEGLRLTTGSANSLRFIVDGKMLPPLKSAKRVVRAIDLSPLTLKSRLD